MILNDEMEQQFESLSLSQILQQQDLLLEQLLSIKNIHHMIKSDLETFLHYCKDKEEFTDRLIILGLKCPMHESDNPAMKKMAFICNDILTADRTELAELIMYSPTDQPLERPDKNDNGRHYKYLDTITHYFTEPDPDPTCINYIAKVLLLLTNWKYIESFTKYLKRNNQVFERLVHFTLHPSIAHLFSKLLTFSSEYYSSEVVNSFKVTIMAALLTKVHEEIGEEPTSLIFYCFEEVLNFVRRKAENEPQDNIPHICNLMVSKSEIGYHLNTILSTLTAEHKSTALLYSLQNSLNYLRLVVDRMKLNEVNEDETSQCRPLISFRVDQLFSAFCQLLQLAVRLEQFLQYDKTTARLTTLQYLQTLKTICQLQQFDSFYHHLALPHKTNALNALISLICEQTSFGIIFQSSIALLESLLLREQQLLEKDHETQSAIPPHDLLHILAEQREELSVEVYKMTNLLNSNKNVKNIHVRKLLMLIDTYFTKYRLVHKKMQAESLQTLFEEYTPINCKKYDDFITLQCGYPIPGYSFPKERSFNFFSRNKTTSQTLAEQQQRQTDTDNGDRLPEQKQIEPHEEESTQLTEQQEPTQLTEQQEPTQLTEQSSIETGPAQDSKIQTSPIPTPPIVDSTESSTNQEFVESLS